jgi:hypothetical protein
VHRSAVLAIYKPDHSQPPVYSHAMPAVPPHLPVVAADAALDIVDDISPAVKDFAVRVSGAPASELGGLLADKIRYRRWRNQIQILKRATEYAQDAGIDPQTVDLKVLTPLLEQAANEEDEQMADRWAALLANAASADSTEVSPSFPNVLARLSPMDAKVLDAIHHALSNLEGLHVGVTGVHAIQIAEHYKWPAADVRFSFENLQVLGVCASASPAMVEAEQGRPKQGLLGSDRSYVVESEFGKRFLEACTPPDGNRPTQAGPAPDN